MSNISGWSRVRQDVGKAPWEGPYRQNWEFRFSKAMMWAFHISLKPIISGVYSHVYCYTNKIQFHPLSNLAKMSQGIPLSDEDRWDWLISLRRAATDALSPSEANHYQPPSGVVVSCSALKQKYRDVMRVAAYGTPLVQIHFVYLKLDERVLLQRVNQREAHYMKSGMVHSQLQALEEPQGEWDALTVSVQGPKEEVQRKVSDLVKAKLAEYR